MRVLATTIVIAVAAASAGCGKSSSSSSGAPAQTVTQTTAPPVSQTKTTASPIKTTVRQAKVTAPPTKATSGPGRRATTLSSAGGSAKAVPTHLVARPLDVAERTLHKAGIAYKVIPLHGHANDAAAHWAVCETQPAAGRTERSRSVELLVVYSKCGAR
jgi:hypothetical protein